MIPKKRKQKQQTNRQQRQQHQQKHYSNPFRTNFSFCTNPHRIHKPKRRSNKTYHCRKKCKKKIPNPNSNKNYGKLQNRHQYPPQKQQQQSRNKPKQHKYAYKKWGTVAFRRNKKFGAAEKNGIFKSTASEPTTVANRNKRPRKYSSRATSETKKDEAKFIETVIEKITLARTQKSSEQEMYLVYKSKRSMSFSELKGGKTARNEIVGESRQRERYQSMSLSTGLNTIRYRYVRVLLFFFV